MVGILWKQIDEADRIAGKSFPTGYYCPGSSPLFVVAITRIAAQITVQYALRLSRVAAASPTSSLPLPKHHNSRLRFQVSSQLNKSLESPTCTPPSQQIAAGYCAGKAGSNG